MIDDLVHDVVGNTLHSGLTSLRLCVLAHPPVGCCTHDGRKSVLRLRDNREGLSPLIGLATISANVLLMHVMCVMAGATRHSILDTPEFVYSSSGVCGDIDEICARLDDARVMIYEI